MVPEDDFDIIMDERFDQDILENPILVSGEGPSKDTLNRLGSIKATLVDFAMSPEFKDDLDNESKDRFGRKKKLKKKGEWINFLDWFILECELTSGDRIVDRFLETYQDDINPDIYKLVEGWKKVIEGLFEVKEIVENGYFVKNLINEREYKVYSTHVSGPLADVHRGDFLIGRIVPALGFHIFSGAHSPVPLDGKARVRDEMYQIAAIMQTEHPERALADNPEKLQKSREAVRKMYTDFVSYFGKDEVFGTGKEIRQYYKDFFDFQIFEMRDPDTGKTRAEEFEKRTGKRYKPPKQKFPRELLRNKDVAMLCDPVESLIFLEEYGLFLKIFTDPDKHLGTSYAADVIMGYLESDTISDVPFRRAAQRFPDNFKKVINYFAEQEDFVADNLEDLIQAFKPESYEKIPSIVVVMDKGIADARLMR